MESNHEHRRPKWGAHKVKQDRTREHGALANPGGRPHRINAA
jgi:hypothetical protein